PERQPPHQRDQPRQALAVEEELLVAEDEAGKPAVEAAVGDEMGDSEVGPHEVGHDVLAGRWSRSDHRLDEPGGDCRPEKRTGPEGADPAPKSAQFTTRAVCMPSLKWLSFSPLGSVSVMLHSSTYLPASTLKTP